MVPHVSPMSPRDDKARGLCAVDGIFVPEASAVFMLYWNCFQAESGEDKCRIRHIDLSPCRLLQKALPNNNVRDL
jgi:hypothetical protein